MIKNYFLTIVICFSFISAKSQFYHDVGIVVGNTYFTSDFGEAGDFKNFYANNGVTFGAVYYIALEGDRRNSWKEYFKLRTELMFMHTELSHEGKWVVPANNGVLATQLRAMKGSTSVANLGFQLEFYPLKTDDNRQGLRFSPYGSIGFQLNSYSSTVTSSLGAIGNPLTTPPKYIKGIRNENGFTTSFSISAGTRYKISDDHAIFADLRLLRYNSDWVDGMNPDRTIYKENTANDYNLTLSLGYIFLFN